VAERVLTLRECGVAQTFLVDGFVAGTWRVENGRVVAELFGKLSRSAQRRLGDEARGLEAFLADVSAGTKRSAA
jgi:hypothetical protein